MNNKHLISIIGAGPGDPELLTVKAYKRIHEADVILHDALQGEEILELALQAELVYVGKHCNDGQNPVQRQKTIHLLMFQYANLGKKVVRLKAGDPMVFGRGAEEIRFCRENKLNYEVIPGITTAIAASNLLEVPLTERNKSPMVLLYTGTLKNDEVTNVNSVFEVLKCGGSVSVYMGLKNISVLAKQVINKGISPDLPLQVISKVSQKDQGILSTSLGRVEELMTNEIILTPAIFILGQHATQILPEETDHYEMVKRPITIDAI